MSLNWDAFRAAMNDAKATMRQGDDVVRDIGALMPGRLRLLSGDTLVQLKRELARYNARTGKWKP